MNADEFEVALLGMKFGIWREDIRRYVAIFPVQTMAEHYLHECAYPHFSQIHNIDQMFDKLKHPPKAPKYRTFYGIHKPTPQPSKGEG